MDYDGFINKYLGQPIDWDGLYGAQCVDEVAQYCSDNNMPVAYANAKDWWQNPALTGAFDFVANDTNQPDQLPDRGNIVIFSGNQPGSGGYGHINIFDMRTGANTWQGLDQNWGGQYVHFISNHVWDYVIGWMVPKQSPPPVPAPDNHPDPAPPEPTPQPAPEPEPVPSTEPTTPTPPQPEPTPPVPPSPAPGSVDTLPPAPLPRGWLKALWLFLKNLLGI